MFIALIIFILMYTGMLALPRYRVLEWRLRLYNINLNQILIIWN